MVSDEELEYNEMVFTVGRALEKLAAADLAGPENFARHLKPLGCEFCLEEAQDAIAHHGSLGAVQTLYNTYKKSDKREKNLAVCKKHAVEGEVIVGLSHGNPGGHVNFAFKAPPFAYDLWERRWSARLAGDGDWTVVNFGLTHFGVAGLGAVELNRTSFPVRTMIEGYDIREIKAFRLAKTDLSSVYLAISYYIDNPFYSVAGRNCLDITYEAIQQLNAALSRPLQYDTVAPSRWFQSLPGLELVAAKYKGSPAAAMQFATSLPPRVETPLATPVKPIPHG